MLVSMHVCTHAHLCAGMCACIHACLCVHACMDVCIFICPCLQTYVPAFMCPCIYGFVQVSMHACMFRCVCIMLIRYIVFTREWSPCLVVREPTPMISFCCFYSLVILQLDLNFPCLYQINVMLPDDY